MDTVVPTLNPHTEIFEAVTFLLDNHVTGAPVVDAAGTMIGILTEFDCLRLLAEGEHGDRPGGVVEDFMTRDVRTVTPDTDVYYAAGIFLANRFRRLPVVENGKLVGAITRFDILRVIRSKLS